MQKKNQKVEKFIDTEYNDFSRFQDFEKKCRLAIENIISSLPPKNFVNHESGVFYICFTGNDKELVLEKFRFSGFSKEDLYSFCSRIGKNLFED